MSLEDDIFVAAQCRMMRDTAPIESLEEMRELKEELSEYSSAQKRSSAQALHIAVISLCIAVATLIATVAFGILAITR